VLELFFLIMNPGRVHMNKKKSLAGHGNWIEVGIEKTTGKTPIFWNNETFQMRVTLPNGKTVFEKCQKPHHAGTVAMNIAITETGESL